MNANLINLNKKGLIECNKNRTRREIKIADHPLQDLIKEKIDSEILEQRRESAAEIERLQLNAAIMMRLRLSGDKYETTDSESGS